MIAKGRFRRDRHGKFRPGLVALEQELLSTLPHQAQNLLKSDDPSIQRVFPVAYPDDAHAQSDYQEMMGTALLRRHQHTLDTLASTASAPTLDEDEMHEWLDALEVLRLVLGTQLDVSEDMTHADIDIDSDDPEAQQYFVYGYLSMLQGEIIDALSETLPTAGTQVEDIS